MASGRMKSMSIDVVVALQQGPLADIACFKREALVVHDTLVLPTWMGGPLHGFNQTLYGYMMRAFSLIDQLFLLLVRYTQTIADHPHDRLHGEVHAP
jgi:hypothetical protein